MRGGKERSKWCFCLLCESYFSFSRQHSTLYCDLQLAAASLMSTSPGPGAEAAAGVRDSAASDAQSQKQLLRRLSTVSSSTGHSATANATPQSKQHLHRAASVASLDSTTTTAILRITILLLSTTTITTIYYYYYYYLLLLLPTPTATTYFYY